MGRSIWAVVVAGGSGTRYGRPKQFDRVGGRAVMEWSVDAARSVADGVVLVLPRQSSESGPEEAGSRFGADVVAPGGPTRSASVRSGLGAVPPDAGIVVVHDAARPLASAALFAAVVDPLLEPGSTVAGVICAVSVTDTLKRLSNDGSTVAGTIDRSALVAVQTPQAFVAETLRRAHRNGDDATDDAALVEAIGGTVRVVPGDSRNLKLTTPADLAYIEHLLVGGR